MLPDEIRIQCYGKILAISLLFLAFVFLFDSRRIHSDRKESSNLFISTRFSFNQALLVQRISNIVTYTVFINSLTQQDVVCLIFSEYLVFNLETNSKI